MILVHSDEVNDVDTYIDQGKHVFILVYMDGCGPCMATKPEWLDIEDFLKDKYKNDDSIVVADIENDQLSKLKYVGEVDGFPTMKYIHKNNSDMLDVETYENADIKKKDRSAKSFVEWIEGKMESNKNSQGGGNIRGGGKRKSSPYHVLRRLSKKTKKKRSKSKKRNRNRKKTRIKKRR